MSGGYFDYRQHQIGQIADLIDGLIVNYGKGDSASYSPDVIAKFKRAANLLREAEVYAHRIDWLHSGDDSEAAFRFRLEHDLSELRPYPEEES